MIVLSKWSALSHEFQVVGVYSNRDSLPLLSGDESIWQMDEFELNDEPVPNEDDEARATGALQ